MIADLSKDISWQGQVQGTVEALRSETRKVEKAVDLLSKLLMHWFEYYFTYTKSLGDMPKSQKILLAEEGRARTKSMIEAFKKNMKNKPGLLEIMLADYFVQEEKAE